MGEFQELIKGLMEVLVAIDQERIFQGKMYCDFEYVEQRWNKRVEDANTEFRLTNDELFELTEYGFEDDDKLTQDAIVLKIDILQRVARKYLHVTKKWFGDSE